MRNVATEEAMKSLKRIHEFDTASLAQAEKLGEINFSAAVEPAQRLGSGPIDLLEGGRLA